MTTIHIAASEIRKGDALVSWKGCDFGGSIITKKILSNRGNVIAYYGEAGRWKMKASDPVVIQRADA